MMIHKFLETNTPFAIVQYFETVLGVIGISNKAYEYHATTSFPDKSFEENCKNNFLQHLSSK